MPQQEAQQCVNSSVTTQNPKKYHHSIEINFEFDTEFLFLGSTILMGKYVIDRNSIFKIKLGVGLNLQHVISEIHDKTKTILTKFECPSKSSKDNLVTIWS